MFESLVGLDVRDEEGYRKYREAMIPILEMYGGSFRYDFVVSRVLKTESAQAINRVFIIAFPDQDHKERFFADTTYRLVRQKHFEPSVRSVTIIAEYNRS